MQVLAHRGRPHHNPLFLGQGLGQLRGRPGALAGQQPVQGPPHLPAAGMVRPRPQLLVAHGLEALLLELADPAAHRGLAAVEVARQRGHRHPVGREQVHFDPVPLAGGQVRVAAQLHQAPALAGGELDVQGGGHGERTPDHRRTRSRKDSTYLDIGPHEGLSASPSTCSTVGRDHDLGSLQLPDAVLGGLLDVGLLVGLRADAGH